jgi:hypothetical protein
MRESVQPQVPAPIEPSVLFALAERCEREEPSRELDLAISAAVDYRGAFQPIYPGESYRWGAGGDEIDLLSKTGKRIGVLDPQQFVPRYTTSLDAAVTLVPAGDDVFWRAGHDGEGPDPGLFFAEVLVCRLAKPFTGFRARARTEPMARVAAALRARAAMVS